MKIKPWLMISYLVVMILPIIVLYFFYISLLHFDEKRDFKEYMEAMDKVTKLDSILSNPSYYQVQDVENYRELQDIVDSSMNIKLYRDDGLKLYSTIDNTGVEIYSVHRRNFTYQDLNVLKKDYRTYTYKKPVFNEDNLIGIYEITMTRDIWLEGVQNRTLILGGCLVITFMVIYGCVIILLNRKLNRPLHLLKEEMNAFAKGKSRRIKLPQTKDEIGELMAHFSKMREEIEAKNKEIKKQQQEKEYIIAALSHDLKTPLTAIRAYFEVISRSQELSDQEMEVYRAIIFEKLDYMKEMVDDLNVFTKLKSTAKKIEFVDVDGEEFFDMLLGGYEGTCRERGINLTVEQNVSAHISVNVKQMIRVVDNLMSNAIRYTDKGKNIWLAAISQSNPLPTWIFAPFIWELESWRKNGTIILIQNEGKEISKKDLDNVFEPFVQLEEARGQGGTSGLGLSIAKMIMEQHGGKIKLWSHPNYGTLAACWLKEG